MSGIGCLQAGVVNGPLSVALIVKNKKTFENSYRIGRPCHRCPIGRHLAEIMCRYCRQGVTGLVSKAPDSIAPKGRLPDLAGEDGKLGGTPMQSMQYIKSALPLLLTACFVAAASACSQHDAQSPAADGLDDFREVVEAAYQRLTGGRIQKKAGFFGECSVDWRTESGIRVSETVCDDGKDSWKVTIRVTDPTSRPPSQRQTQMTVALDEERDLTLLREKMEQLENGVTLRLDRTGQSVVLDGPVRLEPSEQ